MAAIVGGLVGWSISASLASERQRFQQQAQQDIGNAKKAIDGEIAEEFKKENVQKTLDLAVGRVAPDLFTKAVEPNIKAFQQKLDTSEVKLDQRLKDFNETLSKNEEKSSANVKNLRTELTRLQERNDLAALADKAISEGDVPAYRKLEALANAPPRQNNAAISELMRVIQAYSVFSGVSRTAGVQLNVKNINASKTKEEELEVDDLLPLLKIADDSFVRAKITQLIGRKAKHGSYKMAEAIVQAIRSETHLEVHKALGEAFRAVTGYQAEGTLDNRDSLKWWEENKDRLKREDTDATPTPTPTPQPSATAAKSP